MCFCSREGRKRRKCRTTKWLIFPSQPVLSYTYIRTHTRTSSPFSHIESIYLLKYYRKPRRSWAAITQEDPTELSITRGKCPIWWNPQLLPWPDVTVTAIRPPKSTTTTSRKRGGTTTRRSLRTTTMSQRWASACIQTSRHSGEKEIVIKRATFSCERFSLTKATERFELPP